VQPLLPHILGWSASVLSLRPQRRHAAPFRAGPTRGCGRRLSRPRTSVSVHVPYPGVCTLADIWLECAVPPGTPHPELGARSRALPAAHGTQVAAGASAQRPGDVHGLRAHRWSHTSMKASCAAGHRRSTNKTRHPLHPPSLAAPHLGSVRAPPVSGSALAQHRADRREASQF
jgi:hypothetical protein